MKSIATNILVDIVKHLPQSLISRMWGWLTRCQKPRFAIHLFKQAFVAFTGIDMADSIYPLTHFDSLESLFVRRFKDGLRPISPLPHAVVSPVDGKVGCFGTILEGTLIQAKGRHYPLATLLDDDDIASDFDGGTFLTIYLAPHNYHRIHAPCSGLIDHAVHLPGALFPVFPAALERIECLFARNERLISYITCPLAQNTALQTAPQAAQKTVQQRAPEIALVKVGATLVGRITLAYDDSICTNRPRATRKSLHYNPAVPMTTGQELATFELGSTVILLFKRDVVTLAKLSTGQKLLMGEQIGTLIY